MEFVVGFLLFACACRLLYWLGFPRSWAVFGGILGAVGSWFLLGRMLQQMTVSVLPSGGVGVLLVVVVLAVAISIGFWLGRLSIAGVGPPANPF